MAKTGAYWEKKETRDEEDEIPVGNSKLFLNRQIHRDFRVNELFRKKAEKIENVDAEEEEEFDEYGLPIEKKKEEEVVEEEEKTPEPKVEETTKKKDEPIPVTKEEYAVTKHVRFNTLAHEGRLAGMTVKCFIASDAVNCLLDSKWAKGKANSDSEIYLSDRKSCVRFMNSMLEKGLFHRADRVEKRKDKEKRKKKKEIEEKERKKEEEKEKESATEDKKSKKDKKTKKPEKELEEVKKEEKKEDDKKKVKKFKLSMAEDQRFVDGNSLYVWIYDPIHPKTFFIGALMLIGAAALCLFPLWPDWMRILVYWCSLLGASFVGFMLFLIVLRVIIFSIVWVLTMGKHHFWIFPNLTEDCGVIESFKPFIKHDVYDSTKELKEKAKKKRLEKEEAELEEEENDSENENDKNNGFEMINGQEENNDREIEENLDEEDGENEEEDEEEIGSDEIETKKDK